jgi:haloalkane dehalogenase
MQTLLGKLLYLTLNISPRVIMKQAFADKSKLSPELHRQYLGPFPTPQSRTALLDYARSFIASDAFFASLWQQRERIKDIPALILWGMKDIAFREKELKRLEAIFTNVQTMRLANVGHFVQEEGTAEIAPLIKTFLRRTEAKEVHHVH